MEYHAWTEKDDITVISMHNAGATHREIAVALGRPKSHVATRVWWLRLNGVQLTKRLPKKPKNYYEALNARIRKE